MIQYKRRKRFSLNTTDGLLSRHVGESTSCINGVLFGNKWRPQLTENNVYNRCACRGRALKVATGAKAAALVPTQNAICAGLEYSLVERLMPLAMIIKTVS